MFVECDKYAFRLGRFHLSKREAIASASWVMMAPSIAAVECSFCDGGWEAGGEARRLLVLVVLFIAEWVKSVCVLCVSEKVGLELLRLRRDYKLVMTYKFFISSL